MYNMQKDKDKYIYIRERGGESGEKREREKERVSEREREREERERVAKKRNYLGDVATVVRCIYTTLHYKMHHTTKDYTIQYYTTLHNTHNTTLTVYSVAYKSKTQHTLFTRRCFNNICHYTNFRFPLHMHQKMERAAHKL